jgi:ATP-dependent Clp protease ATP-binding subunit ClpC
MTSNLGTEFVRRSGSLGFLQRTADADERAEHEKIEKALKSTFRPEFLNRIDEIITFAALSREQMREIVDLQMKEVQDRLSEHGLKVELTSEARNWLADVGYDPSFGARPLRRALQKHVESPLSVSLLSGEFHEGDTILVDVDEGSNTLVFRNAVDQIVAEQVSQVNT